MAVSTEGGPELVSIAEHLSTLIGHPRTAWKATRNPVCCFWVEINHWTAIPGQPGYVIVIHPGGSTLHASDLGQAREAVEFIEKHRRVIDGKVWLPLGVSTNFPISVPMLQATGRTRDD